MSKATVIIDRLEKENPNNTAACKALMVEALRELDAATEPEKCPEPVRPLTGSESEQ